MLLSAMILAQATVPVFGAAPTPDMQSAVRAATYEIVLRKPLTDPLTYEQPLPLDLIPFAVRNDAYWSIGTAFAVKPNVFVTAAHVLVASVGSQFGTPALRDSAGHVFPVDRIIGFSAHEDFAVLTVSGAPGNAVLATSASHPLDSPVYAVGNALGEGVVIRDGLLTSETPEQQDGRWNWLRFSAAASPGNSGGPLLDADGKVIAVVLAKSPNENLNYGLPIERVLKGINLPGSIDVRYSIKLPITRETQVAAVRAQFDLPASFADFSRAYLELLVAKGREDQARLLKAQAEHLFPKGNSAKVLTNVYESLVPAFVQQQTDDSWDVTSASNEATVDLPPKGLVTTATDLGVTVFRLRRPATGTDEEFYRDPRGSMELLLKGLRLSRPVGNQQIRITSLGKPQRDSFFADSFGRHWQVRVWPLGFADLMVVQFALPTPDGYVGFTTQVASQSAGTAIENMRLLGDYFYVSYAGTLSQWAAYLGRHDLRPTVFDKIHVERTSRGGFSYTSPRLTSRIPYDAIAITDQSSLMLEMTYILDSGTLSWDVGAIRAWRDDDRKNYVLIERQCRPSDDASAELRDTWTQMSHRGRGYDGTATHDRDSSSFWIRDVTSALGRTTGTGISPSVLYTITVGTSATSYPRDLEESLQLVRQGTQVLER
jgi:hypothetical protein